MVTPHDGFASNGRGTEHFRMSVPIQDEPDWLSFSERPRYDQTAFAAALGGWIAQTSTPVTLRPASAPAAERLGTRHRKARRDRMGATYSRASAAG